MANKFQSCRPNVAARSGSRRVKNLKDLKDAHRRERKAEEVGRRESGTEEVGSDGGREAGEERGGQSR